MSNSNTLHSKALRVEVSAKRRKRIVYEGGMDFRALLEREHALKIEALIKWEPLEDGKPISKTALLKKMIDRAYNQLPMQAKNDQLDLLATPKTSPIRVRYTQDGNVWSGRGRKPDWVLDFLEQGGDLKDIEV